MASHIPTDLQWADLVARIKAAGSAITVDSTMSNTSENPVQNKVIYNALQDKANSADLATVATTGDYDDLQNLPTIPVVNNAELTIQVNGATIDSFTANSATDTTINIPVPTNTSDLTNDSDFVVESDLATVATTGAYSDLTGTPVVDATITAGGTNAVQGGAIYTALVGKADSEDIPTAVSELTNDSGYQTATQVETAIDAKISSTYKAAGSVLFANLPQPGSDYEGYVYNIEDDFTTTADFVEGAGKEYPAGTNVAIVNVGTTGSPSFKYDVLGEFIDLSDYVKNTDYATTSTAGLVSVGDGLNVSASGVISVNNFTSSEWSALWA